MSRQLAVDAAVASVEGGPEGGQRLLSQKYDHIFYTGSGEVARSVYAATNAISIASGLALVHASLIAGTTLIVKRLTVTERPVAIVTYMVLLQAQLALIPALFVWQWPTFMGWVWLWALAGGATLGHIFWTRAVRIAEVTQLQPLEFIRLPVAGLFGFMLFSEVPTIWTWIGGAVIFIATALVTRAEVAASR